MSGTLQTASLQALKAPRTCFGVTPQPVQPVHWGGKVLAREGLQGCHRPARPLQLLAVAVAAAAVAPVVGCVSVHLQVLPTRVHVFPRQGHSMKGRTKQNPEKLKSTVTTGYVTVCLQHLPKRCRISGTSSLQLLRKT